MRRRCASTGHHRNRGDLDRGRRAAQAEGIRHARQSDARARRGGQARGRGGDQADGRQGAWLSPTRSDRDGV